MKLLRWYFTDDTPQWRVRASRFLMIATVLVALLLLVWFLVRFF